MRDDAGAVVPDDVEFEVAAGFGRVFEFGQEVDVELVTGGSGESIGERLDVVGRATDTSQACEMTGELAHAGFLPASAVVGDGLGDGFDDARAVGAEECEDEGFGHGGRVAALGGSVHRRLAIIDLIDVEIDSFNHIEAQFFLNIMR